MTGNSYRTQWAYNSFRVMHVTGLLGSNDPLYMPITAAMIGQHPVNKIMAGENPWHGNRASTDHKSAWHNYLGKRGFNMLMGDGHAFFYAFPPAMDDPSIAVFTESPTDMYYPSPDFAWW